MNISVRRIREAEALVIEAQVENIEKIRDYCIDELKMGYPYELVFHGLKLLEQLREIEVELDAILWDELFA